VKVEVVRPVTGAPQDPAASDCSVELQLLDRATSVIATAKVPISEIMSAKGLVLARQIRLDPERDLISDDSIVMHGSLALRWLALGYPEDHAWRRPPTGASKNLRSREPRLDHSLEPWSWGAVEDSRPP